MKKIILIVLIGATTSLMALYAEHASLYKDPRIMGMGGTSMAVGSYSTSVFSNPAGLASIKKEHGFVVDLLGLGANGTADVLTFLDDISGVDTAGVDATTEMLNVLTKYDGQAFHIGMDNYTSISKNSDIFAWSLGILAASDLNYMTHTSGGTQGLLVTSSRAYGGVVLGFAKPYETEYGLVDVGVSLKYISQVSYEGGLTMNELLADDIATALQDKYEKSSSGLGADLGVTYHPLVDSYWHPAIAMSIMNIGSMDMDENYGGQPMTVNVGASISPELPMLDKFVFAVDYVDALNANKLRMYTLSNDNTVTYTDYDENDMMKRLRVGVGIGLIDSRLLSATINLGLYQAAYTAGVNIELSLFKLNVATYQENIGTTGTPVEDRRYMAQLGFGW